MSRHHIGTLDMQAMAALTQAEQLHRPTDAETLRREAENLIALGLSIPDAAEAIGLTPPALADLLDPLLKTDAPPIESGTPRHPATTPPVGGNRL